MGADLHLMASFQKSLNSHPLTMYGFRGRTQKCTKLFFLSSLITFFSSLPPFVQTAFLIYK